MAKSNRSPKEPALTPGLRRYMFLTAALTGASILVIEILGAKMLAPFFGTSHFVWTAQIGVTMVALATGYYVGGRVADRYPRLGLLYGAILLAALYLCFSVRLCRTTSYACLHLPLAPGSLLASCLLYFPPLTLLAMTGPFFTRVLSISVETVGSLVGKISSIGTLGSVAGTVLIGYVLIPFFPNSTTMYATALLLTVLADVYWLVWGRPGTGRMSGLIGGVVGALLVAQGIQAGTQPLIPFGRELYRGNSNFGLIQVWQNDFGNHRYYLNDFLCQNSYDPVEKKSLSLFSYMLHVLAKAYYETGAPAVAEAATNSASAGRSGVSTNAPARRLRRVLCIGLGVGMAPMQFVRDGVDVDVIEINPAVIEVGRRYFDLEPERMHILVGDGRAIMNGLKPGYDAVLLDAFLGDSSPAHLMSREAFESMRHLLRPDGVLVINSFGYFTPGRDYFCGSLYRTLSSVFAQGRDSQRRQQRRRGRRRQRVLRGHARAGVGSAPAALPKPRASIVPRRGAGHPAEYRDAAALGRDRTDGRLQPCGLPRRGQSGAHAAEPGEVLRSEVGRRGRRPGLRGFPLGHPGRSMLYWANSNRKRLCCRNRRPQRR